jgi:hypothetical protein
VLIHPSQQKHLLANVKADEKKLQQSVHELQTIYRSLPNEDVESRLITSRSNASHDWNEERGMLMGRLLETERTLVLVANQNEELEKKTAEEKEMLKNRLDETEKALMAVAGQKQLLEKKNSSLEIKLKSSPPVSLPPRPPQNDMSAELSRLQLSFLREKKEMLGRQQGLEKMLMEALSFDKENATELLATPKLSNNLVQSEETRDWHRRAADPSPRRRVRGRSIDP